MREKVTHSFQSSSPPISHLHLHLHPHPHLDHQSPVTSRSLTHSLTLSRSRSLPHFTHLSTSTPFFRKSTLYSCFNFTLYILIPYFTTFTITWFALNFQRLPSSIAFTTHVSLKHQTSDLRARVHFSSACRPALLFDKV